MHPTNAQLKALLALLVVGLLVGCGSSAPMAPRSKGGKKTSKTEKDFGRSGALFGEDAEDGDSEETEEASGDDDGLGERERGGGGDAAIEWPTYTLSANGYTTYNDDDHLTMSMTIESALSEDSVRVDAKAARVMCGDLGGCNQGDVDEDVNRDVLGANVFDTIRRKDLEKMDEYKEARYAFFSKSFSHKRGISFTADKPLPINVFPGGKGRYLALEDGPQSFTARVKSSQPLPHSPGMDMDIIKNLTGPALAMLTISEFTVTIRVSKVDKGGGEIEVTLETDIAEDKNRQIYTYFPVGKRSTYTIDTEKQDLVGVKSLGWSYGDQSNHEEETQLEHRVCAKSVGGKVKRNDCP